MKLVLVENIIYEVLIETFEGKARSEYFNSCNVLESRERALNRFLELTLFDEINPVEMFITLYARYQPTGERVELVNSVTYESGETLDALAQELNWYEHENLAVNLAVYDPAKPQIIKILWPQHRHVGLREGNAAALFLASHYWAFIGRKKEILRFGNVF